MPRVPYTAEPGSNITPMVGQIDPTTLAMAAGMMYSEGKLFEPKPSTYDRLKGAERGMETEQKRVDDLHTSTGRPEGDFGKIKEQGI